MQYAKYSFHDLTWIGPDLSLIPTIARVFKKTLIVDIDAQPISGIRFICPRKEPNMQYALLSSFCLLEDAILSPLDTYSECYGRILSFAADEAYIRPDGVEEVRTCLENHKILDVIG